MSLPANWRPDPPPHLDNTHLQITPTDLAALHPDDAAPADTIDPTFTDALLHALVHAIPAATTDSRDEKLRRKTAAITLLRALDAQEPVQAAIAASAVLCHHASLAAFRRAAESGTHSPEIAGREAATAAGLSATFTRLLHELDWRQTRDAT